LSNVFKFSDYIFVLVAIALFSSTNLAPVNHKSMFKGHSIMFKIQAKVSEDHRFVSICMTELCKNAGFAGLNNLVQRDLMFLCNGIESQTGVIISVSTIKRLLNGQFSRLPQIATLDAIAVTAGYQNWQQFKITKNLGVSKNGKEYKEKSLQPALKGARHFYTRRFLWTIPIVLIAVCLGFIVTVRKSGFSDGKARFSARKVTGNDVPNTVVFSYNIDSVAADSFFIQQSWDRNRRVRIYKQNYKLTDIYFEPGYHTAKLIANDKIIRTVEVIIPTDRWLFYAKEGVTKGLPNYISADGLKSRSFHLTKDDLTKSKIDIQRENAFVNVYFSSRIENSSDNFILRFRIKVDELKNEACPYLMSEVFCQRQLMFFTSTLKGCTSELLSQFGEKKLNGKTSDLSALGSDVTTWQDVEFMVKNKNVTIFINGTKVFAANYYQSCGLITGIGFISNGLCEVDSLNMKTIEGKEIY
jgi:hypothetical protein